MSVHFSRFSLFKRRNGVYAILYYHHGHRRWKSTNATTKPEALQALSHFRELFEADTPSVSFEEFRNRFLASLGPSCTPKTLAMYRTVLERFQKLVGYLYLAEINLMESISPQTGNLGTGNLKNNQWKSRCRCPQNDGDYVFEKPREAKKC